MGNALDEGKSPLIPARLKITPALLYSQIEDLGDSSNGRTTDSDSVSRGSNPRSPAKNKKARISGPFYFYFLKLI